MKISIDIQMPEKKKHRPCLKEKVDEYMEVCNSDEDSLYHWRYLKKLFEALKKDKMCKHNPEKAEIFEKLVRFFLKTNEYASGENRVNLEALDYTHLKDL